MNAQRARRIHCQRLLPPPRPALAGFLAPFALWLAVAPSQANTGTRPAAPGSVSAEVVYQRARAELPAPLYPYYRLLDRIMGANVSINQKATLGIRSLDQASCRQMMGPSELCAVATELPDVKKEDHFLIWALQVAGSTAGAPNAFAQSSNNRIVINKALDLAFAEDLEAKACVLAHEMAHLQQDHSKRRKAALVEWNRQAAGKMTAAIRNAHAARSSQQFWTTLAMVTNAASAGYNSSIGNYNAAAAATNSNQTLAARQEADKMLGRNLLSQLYQLAQGEAPEVFAALRGMEGLPATLVARTMKDVNVYLREVSEQSMALSREHELEADRLAVAYLAKAGINPEGCLRVVANLHRGQYQPVADKEDSHPGEQERLQTMKSAIATAAAEYQRSRVGAARPAPLAYRYDSRLEVVTLTPLGGAPDRQRIRPALDVDALLGR